MSKTRAPKGVKYPEKDSINLIIKDEQGKKNLFALAMFALFIIGLALFTKFLVIDQMRAVDKAAANYREKETYLNQLIENNTVYDEVTEQYYHHSSAYLSNDELVLRTTDEMMEVIDGSTKGSTGISEISIDGNTAIVNIESIALSSVASLVDKFENYDIVEFVYVSTAKKTYSDTSEVVDATIEVTFTDAVEIEEVTAEDLGVDEEDLAGEGD